MGSWADDDLDKGIRGVKEDIARIEGQMKEGFAGVGTRFERVDERSRGSKEMKPPRSSSAGIASSSPLWP